MKKVIIPMLLASALCAGLAGCTGNNNENSAVTENTDPKTLVGEQVERAAWQTAFSEGENYTVKTVVNADLTQDEHTVSETITLVYRYTADKFHFCISMKEGGKTVEETEAYAELGATEVSIWQRTKQDGAWSEWDTESYPKEIFGELVPLAFDLGFLKDEYANFAYNEKDMGYAATASGLTEMQEKLGRITESVIDAVADGEAELSLGNLVLKMKDGKLAACLADLTAGSAVPAPEARTEPDNSAEGDETGPDDSGDAPGSGDSGGEGAPDAPLTGKVMFSQLFYDYGKTEVARPEGLPAAETEE